MEMQENRVFEQMLKAAKANLENRSPQEIAGKAGIVFDSESSSFQVSTLGENVTVHYPGFDMEPTLRKWRQILILLYMDMADGTPLTGNIISFTQMKDGMVRGGDFNRRCDQTIRDDLGKQSEAELRAKCESLGAQIIKTNADFTAVFPFLPKFPMTLKIWFADDEFDASGQIFLDSSCGHYLAIEASVFAGETLLEMLTE